MQQGSVCAGIIQETKITDRIHTRYGLGCSSWEIEAGRCQQGEDVVVIQKEEIWQVKGMENFGPNVVSLLLLLRSRRWYTVGEYVPLNNVSTVHWV